MRKNVYKSKDVTISISHNNKIEKIYLELSALCNFSCGMCFRSSFTEKLGNMTHSTIERVKEEIVLLPKLREVVLGGIGEPLLYPEVDELVTFLKSLDLDVILNTNAELLGKHLDFLLDKQINKIIFSCETDNNEHNNKAYLIENIEKIIANNKESTIKTKIALQMVLTKDNIGKLPNFVREMLKKYKIDEIRFSNILPIKDDMIDSILYLKDEPEEISKTRWIGYSKTNMVIPNFELKTERYCNFMENHSLVVRWDGEICPCYRLLHSGKEIVMGRHKQIVSQSFGNITSDGLLDIWNRRDYTWFRYKVENALFPSCTDCSLEEVCHYVETTEIDCWGNSPSCADCLWYRKILICP